MASQDKKKHLPSIKKLEEFRKTSIECAQKINGQLTSILGAAEELWSHVDKKDFFATEQIEMIIRTVDNIQAATSKLELKNDKIHQNQTRSKDARATKKGTRILLAEDDKDNRNILKIMLEKMGYNVDVAKDGLEAWEKFQANKYEVVISDIQMPGLNGIKLLKKIHQKKSEMPVLLITGYSKEEPREMARKEDNIYFLKKPFRKNKLHDVVEEALS